MPFLGLMTVRAHEAAVRELRRLVEVQRDNKRWMAESMDGEARHLRRQLDKALTEIATLRPDAEKHRERVRKATMNLKQNRAKAGAGGTPAPIPNPTVTAPSYVDPVLVPTFVPALDPTPSFTPAADYSGGGGSFGGGGADSSYSSSCDSGSSDSGSSGGCD